MPLHIKNIEPHVTLITIDNPAKMNAISRAMMAELADAWDELDRSDCRAVVITGTGERAFCAGADLSGDLSASEETARMVNRALLKDVVFTKPIIAAVNGTCAGGGVELMLSTDIRIASNAARFGLPEVRWSVYPFGGATVKLTEQIGFVHAMDLLLTGRMVGAEYAERIGLVNELVPAVDVLDVALERARLIAKNSPSAVQAVKHQISATVCEHVRDREELEQSLGDQVRVSAHFQEGVDAFKAKREPDYS